MISSRSKSRPSRAYRPVTGDRARDGDILYLFEQPWVETWMYTTALLLGFDPGLESRDSSRSIVRVMRKIVSSPFIRTSDIRSIVFYADGGVVLSESTLLMLIEDPAKRYFFIEGRKDEFFADSPA